MYHDLPVDCVELSLVHGLLNLIQVLIILIATNYEGLKQLSPVCNTTIKLFHLLPDLISIRASSFF